MGDTIEVIDGLDSDSTTDFNIFQHFRHLLVVGYKEIKNTKPTEGICLIES